MMLRDGGQLGALSVIGDEAYLSIYKSDDYGNRAAEPTAERPFCRSACPDTAAVLL